MQNYVIRITLILILFLQISACSLLSPVKTPPINTYTLTTKKSSVSVTPRRRTEVLLIAQTTAAPGYQDSNMIYTLRPYELKSFANNRWTAPPAEMLTTLLAESLQASGCFHAVVASPFAGDSQLTLETYLLSLQQEFSGNTSQVRMALRLTLLDNVTHQVLTNQRVEAVVPVAENNPYHGVIAANAAADIVLHKTRRIICQQVKK